MAMPGLIGFESSAPREPAVNGEPTRVCLDEHQLRTLRLLCDLIIPPDEESPGAVEAGATEFIDLLASENSSMGLHISGGLWWLNSVCSMRYGQVFENCSKEKQRELLNIIAVRENAAQHPPLQAGVPFFLLIRRLTLDGFFTSAIGYKYLQYIGNDYLSSFEGCPRFSAEPNSVTSPPER
jgi:hypothetical protein